jgi:hypothetical protein
MSSHTEVTNKVIKFASRWYRRTISYLIHGGSWYLRQYETLVLNTVAKSLSSEDASALSLQLENLDHIKRLHSDRMVTFYFLDTDKIPRLYISSSTHCIARYRLDSSGFTTNVALFTHLGILSSIEFTKSPEVLSSDSEIKLVPILNKSNTSLTDTINQEEHYGDGV